MYKPTAILSISRYSDAGVVMKREASGYVQFSDDHFSTSKTLTASEMADLMDTCGHILVFYHQVCCNVVHETPIYFGRNHSQKYYFLSSLYDMRAISIFCNYLNWIDLLSDVRCRRRLLHLIYVWYLEQKWMVYLILLSKMVIDTF